jgi:DNA gyrase subunit A
MDQIAEVALSTEAQRLYLNYALSVIQARALPDVRDGLKPVQRRILYTMHNELRLNPQGKPAKCARIVGDVIGKFHPHGDVAVYDALVRMAQDWVMRAPLIQGQGNFGSLDGDAPAAYRYTEARLEPIALELLQELGQGTTDFRPTYDAVRSEPIVLPARFPNLLVNGAQGIAVGMATSIPPHNLGEVVDALVALIEDPTLTVAKLMGKVKGPDFPTGGEITSTKAELRAIYETGQGSVRVRGEWKVEEVKGGGEQVIVTSIPYALEKRALVEKIADVIISKKLPALLDVRDESTDQVRVVLEIKKGANAELVMAYLNKHTPLQGNVAVNLTCLVPTDRPEVQIPERLDLKAILQHFLNFRFDVITRRLEHELGKLKDRLHILEGFEKVFDALDEIIRIIRKSEGKQDAAEKIMKRFGLDEVQTDAILELKLYRLARLEILIIQKEADEKRKAIKGIEALLKGTAKRWELVKSELQELRAAYGDKRRSKIVGGDKDPEFSAEDFIVDEDVLVIVTEQGWVKRQASVRDLTNTRLKANDRVLACVAGSTRACVAFFSSKGHCYVTRIAEVPASTGYGDPIQKLFKFEDKEHVVAAVSFDPRFLALPEEELFWEDGTPCPPYGVAVTRQGMALRFPLFPHKEPSTRSGRKFAKLKEGDEVLTVFTQVEGQTGYVVAAAKDGHALAVELEETAVLAGPGRGTILIKLGVGVELLAARYAKSPRTDALVVRTDKGKKFELFAEGLLGARGGRGKPVVKRSDFAAVDWELPEVPDLGGAKE